MAKVAGSVVENANLAKNVAHANLQNPDSELWREFAQSSYDAIAGLDNLVSKPITSDSGKIAQALFKYDVIETIKRYDPDFFAGEGAVTLADEEAVLKKKLIDYTMNVHGFGSGQSGNRLNLRAWNGSAWSNLGNLTSGSVNKLSYSAGTNFSWLRDGFVNVLAYASAANETIPSVVNIDCANLEITLPVTDKAENVSSGFELTDLDSNTEYTVKVVNAAGESEEITFKTAEITYKEVTLTLDFKGKTAGSEVENPHIFGTRQGATLYPLDEFTEATSQKAYDDQSTLDDVIYTLQTPTTALMRQFYYKWAVIEAIERNIHDFFSKENAVTTAEKVSLVLERQTSMTFNVHGYGTGAEGNKLNVARQNGLNWTAAATNSKGSIENVTGSYADGRLMDSEGKVHILAYAATSNGTIPSTLNIDYANLEITLLVEED